MIQAKFDSPTEKFMYNYYLRNRNKSVTPSNINRNDTSWSSEKFWSCFSMKGLFTCRLASLFIAESQVACSSIQIMNVSLKSIEHLGKKSTMNLDYTAYATWVFLFSKDNGKHSNLGRGPRFFHSLRDNILSLNCASSSSQSKEHTRRSRVINPNFDSCNEIIINYGIIYSNLFSSFFTCFSTTMVIKAILIFKSHPIIIAK